MTASKDIPSIDEITRTHGKILGAPEFSEAHRRRWQDEPIDLTLTHLKIMGHTVMERWEEPYMERLAQIATSKRGRVLEVGFGMGISAGFIQEQELSEHVIIEANREVMKNCVAWAGNTRHKVVPINGFSYDVSPLLASGAFDGVLYDTYPLEAQEVNRHHQAFFAEAHRLLARGGVFTFFCNQDERIAPEDEEVLLELGFEVSWEKVPIPTPDDCQYWRAKTIVAPVCVKL